MNEGDKEGYYKSADERDNAPVFSGLPGLVRIPARGR